MAEYREVRLIDDVDGSPGDETLTFALDSKEFEIDLSEANAAKLREAFAPYIAAARRATSSSTPRRQAVASPRRDLSAVRAWLQQAGYDVGDRGRISADLMEAYDEQRPATASTEVDEEVESYDEADDVAGVPALTFQAAG